jgi:transposase
MHFTPTYSSWLNQVELWFAKIERDVIAREYSPPSPISSENSCATFANTTSNPNP